VTPCPNLDLEHDILGIVLCEPQQVRIIMRHSPQGLDYKLWNRPTTRRGEKHVGKRHLDYFTHGSREESLVDRISAMDFGDDHALFRDQIR
jgi:hypothetical protein